MVAREVDRNSGKLHCSWAGVGAVNVQIMVFWDFRVFELTSDGEYDILWYECMAWPVYPHRNLHRCNKADNYSRASKLSYTAMNWLIYTASCFTSPRYTLGMYAMPCLPWPRSSSLQWSRCILEDLLDKLCRNKLTKLYCCLLYFTSTNLHSYNKAVKYSKAF
jgi:hypothetical protein